MKRPGLIWSFFLVSSCLVACGDDGSPADSGNDAAVMDANVADSGPMDAATSDANEEDAGPIDTGLGDIGVNDTGVNDSGVNDSGVSDSGVNDSGVSDSGVGDTGVADAGTRSVIFPGFCPSTDTAPGLYQGTLASNLNDIESASCLGPTPGRDGALRITVPSGATLRVVYESSGDGILYVLDSCPVVSSCLVGADSTSAGAETVSWTNSGPDNPVYVVLDNADLNDSGAFTVDLFLE